MNEQRCTTRVLSGPNFSMHKKSVQKLVSIRRDGDCRSPQYTLSGLDMSRHFEHDLFMPRPGRARLRDQNENRTKTTMMIYNIMQQNIANPWKQLPLALDSSHLTLGLMAAQ